MHETPQNKFLLSRNSIGCENQQQQPAFSCAQPTPCGSHPLALGASIGCPPKGFRGRHRPHLHQLALVPAGLRTTTTGSRLQLIRGPCRHTSCLLPLLLPSPSPSPSPTSTPLPLLSSHAPLPFPLSPLTLLQLLHQGKLGLTTRANYQGKLPGLTTPGQHHPPTTAAQPHSRSAS